MQKATNSKKYLFLFLLFLVFHSSISAESNVSEEETTEVLVVKNVTTRPQPVHTPVIETGKIEENQKKQISDDDDSGGGSGGLVGGLLNGLLESFASSQQQQGHQQQQPPQRQPHPQQQHNGPQKPPHGNVGPPPPPPLCPGRCTPLLASVFMCDRILEDPQESSSSPPFCHGSYACCVSEETYQLHNNKNMIKPSDVLRDDIDEEQDEEEEDDEKVSMENNNNNKNTEMCPGACLSKSIAKEHCEKVLEGNGFCPKQSLCCVKSGAGKFDTSVNRNGSLEDDVSEEIVKKKKACAGTCRSMIFGLFLCDEIDGEAECEESHQGCCIMREKPLEGPQGPHQGPHQGPPMRRPQGPQGYPPQHFQGPPPQRYPSHPPQEEAPKQDEITEDDVIDESVESSTSSSTSTTTTTTTFPKKHRTTHHPQQQQQPRPHQQQPVQQQQPQRPPQQHFPLPCPSYCVPLQAFPYCRAPMANYACGLNARCCGHDLQPIMTTPPPPPPQTTPPQLEASDEEEEDPSQFIDSMETSNKRPLCPGQCIRPIMSFTCFLNAEMTEEYVCEDRKMKCCAPKKVDKNATIATTTLPIGGLTTPATILNNNNVMKINSYNKFPPQQFPQNNYPPQEVFPQRPNNNNIIDRNSFPVTQQPIMNHHIPAPIIAPPRYVCGVKGQPTINSIVNSNNNGLLSRKKRVVGGRDSLPGEWCWQVALINSLNQYLCGGALIGVEWVLTAAHCVTNIVRSGDPIYIRVGDHDLTSKYGSPGAQTLRVATTYIHHNHNSQTLDNDIALLKLQGPAILKEGVCLICLPSRSLGNSVQQLLPGRRCTVTGYGYMGESGPIPLRVREAELPIVSDSECVRKVNVVTEKPFVLPVSSFCAGGEEKNDACQGDGGGPLVCKSEEDDYYELTGLVSWGFGCGRKDVPGVYVKVSSFIGWINQIISISN